ncbi:MAG: nitroreductase family protein [Planctomycetota bacterium]|jgi:nitroreductase|nr:nitroreductase family protein [Planctomycetota bacterium]
MQVAEAIRSRRSIRKFRSGVEVSQEQVEALLAAAMSAPSAMNLRPWEFVVVRDRSLFPALQDVHPYATMLATASLAIVVCGVETVVEWMPQDCAAATQNLLLQALELGLGCCWCGVYSNAERMAGLRRLLGIKSAPFALVAVGVPDEEPASRGGFDISKVRYV